jgi:hypothetical protein
VIKKHDSLYWLDIRFGGKRVRRSLGTGKHRLALNLGIGQFSGH